MKVSFESCLLRTLLSMTLTVVMCQERMNSCDINSRPHPQGYCGARLARAHANLCFLLRKAFPNYFNTSAKRSVDGNLVDRIYNIPLSVLAEMDINNENWGTFINKRDFSYTSPASDAADEAEMEPLAFDHHQRGELSDLNSVSNALFRLLLLKPGDRTKRNTSGSRHSMVCDCCYNACTPQILATYC